MLKSNRPLHVHLSAFVCLVAIVMLYFFVPLGSPIALVLEFIAFYTHVTLLLVFVVISFLFVLIMHLVYLFGLSMLLFERMYVESPGFIILVDNI